MAPIPEKNKLLNLAENLKPYISRTPVLTSKSLNALTSCKLFFKCENFQKTGSFKIRGAMNALLSLNKEQLKNGVVTHSSGNFAQALAYASQQMKVKAAIVMPENVIPAKRDAVIAYGAEIVYSGNLIADRESKCEELVKKTGAVFIHPYNDINVISGHFSCAAELINETEDLDYVFCPVGGGGLLSGIAIGFNYLSGSTKVIAGEPKNADDAYESLKTGKIMPQRTPNTIADGLRTSLGDITFPIIQSLVKEIVLVTEEEIINAMKLIWEKMKIVAEPSGAVPFAAVIKKSAELKNKKIGIIVSGGNINLSGLPF